MTKKCPACGSPVSREGSLCRKCEFMNTLAGSCTGVKYPCSYHCKKCFYDRLYREAL